MMLYKRIAFAVLLAAGLLAHCGALDSSKAHLSFEPYLSCVYGNLGEYVFIKENTSSDYEKLSYLEWEEKPLWLCGFTATGGYSRFYTTVNLGIGIPASCGKMYDSDWQNASDRSMKTNYSVSDNKLVSCVRLGATAGVLFRPDAVFRIMPTAEVSYYNIEFNGMGAELWYGDSSSTGLVKNYAWDDSHAKHFTLSGKVISYNQYAVSTFLGCTFKVVPTDKLSFDLAVAVAPYVFTFSTDTHWQRSERFRDISDLWFKQFKGSLSAHYAFNKTFAAGLSVGGIYGMLEQCDTYTSPVNKDSFVKQANTHGGTDLKEFSATVSMQINLF